jgi:hypothetical protein
VSGVCRFMGAAMRARAEGRRARYAGMRMVGFFFEEEDDEEEGLLSGEAWEWDVVRKGMFAMVGVKGRVGLYIYIVFFVELILLERLSEWGRC